MREWKIWTAAGAVTLVLVLVLIGVFNRYREYRSDNEVRSALEAQVLQLQDENSKIAEDVEYYSNTDNLEKELRARFNLKEPGEKLLIIVPEE